MYGNKLKIHQELKRSNRGENFRCKDSYCMDHPWSHDKKGYENSYNFRYKCKGLFVYLGCGLKYGNNKANDHTC